MIRVALDSLLYAALFALYPAFWVLNGVKRWAERYCDPTTHRAYVVNNWHKFPVDPVVGK